MISEANRSPALRRGCMSGTAIGLLFALGIAPAPAKAQELPSGGSVTAGAAAIATSGPNLTVTQTSQNAILSWQSFSVGGGASAHFQNGTGTTLNRVTGSLPSSIDGSLTATGSLYLINPAGVAVGTGGMVRTGGSFVASTHDTGDADFLDGGSLTLKGSSKAGIVNKGFITSLDGDVVLTARRVENTGTIEASNGNIGLLGGYEVLLRDTTLADGKFAVRVGGADTEVVNTGTLKAAKIELRANGGSVQALAGNTKAIVKATGVKKAGGRIFLTAGDGGTVKATQKTVARRAPTQAAKRLVADLPDTAPIPTARPDYSGGEVHVAGGTVSLGGKIDAAGSGAGGGAIIAVADQALTLTDGAVLDASGADGGLVLLGGDWQGGSNAAANYWHAPLGTTAAATSIAAGTTIRADGISGDGGNVVVWSDGATTVKGRITATGGTAGDGGTIETSGHTIDFTDAIIDASAQNGRAGLWLIDPSNMTFDEEAAATAASILDLGTNTTYISRESSTSSYPGIVFSVGPGDITVAAPIAWSSSATLTLDAWHSIAINEPITIAGAGGLVLHTDVSGTGGTLSFAGGVQYTGTPDSGQSLTINGQDYELLYSMADLQGINTDARLDGYYALAKPLDASGLPGWKPIGTDGAGAVLNGGDGFTGTFTGLGSTISSLVVDIGGNDYAGLFGMSRGSIGDIGLVAGSVRGGSGAGGLVGFQGFAGSITRAYATGAVSGTTFVGGLVGYNRGSIKDSHATGTVTGSSIVGGLIGENDGAFGDGTVKKSWASGSVSGTGRNVGGLVGHTFRGAITQSRASGTVSGTESVGGLVGLMEAVGEVQASYATGDVSGTESVGGLVGSQSGGSLIHVYVSGTVTGMGPNVGGLVGYQVDGGTISGSYFDSYSTGQAASNGVGNIVDPPGVAAVTSDPAQAGAANYAYMKSAYPGLTFIDTPGGTGWYMIEGQMRPFGAWEYSTIINNSHQLQLINMDLNASYQLAGSIDLEPDLAARTITVGGVDRETYPGMWRRGSFVPLGTDGAGSVLNGGSGFSGSFTGLGNTISHLAIDTKAAIFSYAGLFGYSSGSISDVGLVRSELKGTWYAGGLVGQMEGGSIARSYVSKGKVEGDAKFGGLVGLMDGGSITQSYASGDMKGLDEAGGLVGLMHNGDIIQSYAEGHVTAQDRIGGLVGSMDRSDITQSYATGTQIYGLDLVGGLVGSMTGGSITQSYATGKLDYRGGWEPDYWGGLVGSMSGGSITQSYATGTISDAHDYVGGLVGSQDGGSIIQSYATGAVINARDYVGGLVGYAVGGYHIGDSYFDTDSTDQAQGIGNLAPGGGLSGILCARPISSLADEPLAEDDGELGLGLEPFARRSFPFLDRVVQHQI